MTAVTARASSATAAGVVLASGAGTRVGAGINKVFLPVAGRRVVSWSVDALARVPEVGVVLLVVRPDDHAYVTEVLETELGHCAVEVVHGGAQRQESELNALRHLRARICSGEIDAVLMHDAARPLPTSELVTAILAAAREHGGAVPGIQADDLRPLGADGSLARPDEPGRLVRMQTPQGFRARPLLDAYEQAAREGFLGTDTASCIERFSDLPVRWIEGEHSNLKITYSEDLRIAEQLLTDRASS
jgi:2-C-methyl-D-erythritol 4-phosphate cytidylyltransferase